MNTPAETQGGIPLLPARRGLVLTRNDQGAAFKLRLLKKWLRVNTQVFHAEKLDLDADSPHWPLLDTLLADCESVGAPIALRTRAADRAPDLKRWRDQGLADCFLCPDAAALEVCGSWFDAAQAAGLAIRLRLAATDLPLFCQRYELKALYERGLRYLEICCRPPEQKNARVLVEQQGLPAIFALAEAALEAGIETWLSGLSCGDTPESLWPALLSEKHRPWAAQAYLPKAIELAMHARTLPPHRLEQSLEMLLGEKAGVMAKHNHKLLPWMLNGPGRYLPFWIWHKFTRLRPPHAAPAPEAAQPAPSAPLALLEKQPRYLDALDKAALEKAAAAPALLQEAQTRITASPPDVVLTPGEYADAEGLAAHHDTVLHWRGLSRRECLSTPLATLSPPFTIACTLGGGMAEHIGFRFGRHCAVRCPMLTHHHELVLHCTGEGDYVLLRDGRPVSRTELLDPPPRLGDRLEARLSIENIDGLLMSYDIRLWNRPPLDEPLPAPAFSVVIVCTRFARRLQAALLALAHQADFPIEKMEVVVAYVPGLDATEDVLHSLEQSFPDLRLVRAPFPETDASAKGFMINESARRCQGEWLVLLDADILVPPDFMKRLSAETAGAHCLAPAGRKMLDAASTAEILNGLRHPWECYDALLEGPGAVREEEAHGVPIGYCQCVRRSVLEAIPYLEFDHFEGADWVFGEKLTERFGPVKRLPSLRLLHLDHGGSQWFGARRHW